MRAERAASAGGDRELMEDLEEAALASSLSRRLAALAALDPERALRRLLELDRREAGDGPELGAVVSQLLSLAAPSAETMPGLAAVALRRAALLSPSAARVGAFCAASTGDYAAAAAILESAIQRHPADVDLRRDRVSVAERAGQREDVSALLESIEDLDSSQATVRWAYGVRKRMPSDGLSAIRVALLSSYTVDALVPYVDAQARRVGLAPRIYVAPFNTWDREVLDPASGLRSFDPEITFLAVSIDDLIPELAGDLPPSRTAEAGEEALARVVGAVRAYRQWCTAPIVVHGFHSAYRAPLGALDGGPSGSRRSVLEALNGKLEAALWDPPRTFVLDMLGLIARRAGGRADDPRLRHLAGMRLPESLNLEVAREYCRYLSAQMGLTKKCIVLDLDNTLWGGVVGEDGPSGIRLGSSAPGAEFQEFQRFLQALGRQGFLLAIASKNNPAEALEVLRHHPGMVLREQDFSAVRINWRPKAANLRSIAEELSIGLDSLVFVDDNPLERELVRKEHPNLLVVDLPADPALYRGALEKVVQLQPLSVTAEDSNRVQMYRTAERRREALSSASSLEDHLKSLQIVLELGLAAEADLERVRQLFLKTNQFNTTTRRYSQQDVRSFCEGSRHRLYVGRARDRFGDHGLVTVAVVATLGSTWKIESFLMSCRVIGYGIETAMLTEIQADARTSGAVELEGEWIETVKNAPARELFPASGFTVVGKQGESLWYRRSLAEHCAPAPAWIEVVRK